MVEYIEEWTDANKGLRLKKIEEGEYLMIAAPLLVVGAEAAPVRALLIK